MPTITMLHNFHCTTSKNVLEFLHQHGIEPKIIDYMNDVPTREEMKKILMKLHMKPHDLIRTKETYYKNKLSRLRLNDEEWLTIMLEKPALIQRPILIRGHKAIIGRPMEAVEEFIKK